jgi:hypothetical protein
MPHDVLYRKSIGSTAQHQQRGDVSQMVSGYFKAALFPVLFNAS